MIYGYVIDVAASLPRAPRKKASRGVTRRRLASASLRRSKIVYCSMGLITSTRAGSTPAKSASGPSSLINLISVAIVEGFLAGFSDSVAGPGRSEEESD